MANEEKGRLNLEMAEALDEMDKTLSTENADFLEAVLKKLRQNTDLSLKDQKRLETLYKKYFGDDDEEEDADDDEKSEDEEEIDEDDFV